MLQYERLYAEKQNTPKTNQAKPNKKLKEKEIYYLTQSFWNILRYN